MTPEQAAQAVALGVFSTLMFGTYIVCVTKAASRWAVVASMAFGMMLLSNNSIINLFFRGTP